MVVVSSALLSTKLKMSAISQRLIRSGVSAQPFYWTQMWAKSNRFKSPPYCPSWARNREPNLHHISKATWAISFLAWHHRRYSLSITISPICLNTIMKKGKVKSGDYWVGIWPAWLWRNQLHPCWNGSKSFFQ